MVSGTTWLAIVLVVTLIGIGVAQNLHLPQSTLAGAATTATQPKTQQEINLCMDDCMRACATSEDQNAQCLKACDVKCGV